MQIRNIIRAMLSAFALISFTTSIQAADAPVKREMRSAWVATVWNLDWPPSKISETGNASQIKKQQDAMTALLDSLAVNNMNAVNFQVRSRSDAMYKSSYEPWSSDLVSTRGLDPGWDPLEWVVAECHKRGLECHAWVNPYRYESQVNQWKPNANFVLSIYIYFFICWAARLMRHFSMNTGYKCPEFSLSKLL